MGIATMIGASIKRREDPRLITGQATYVDDIKLIGMLHMAVLRSPYGHARITSIETEAARKHPGVVAVYTAEDLKGRLVICRWACSFLPTSKKAWGGVAHWLRARCASMAIRLPSLSRK